MNKQEMTEYIYSKVADKTLSFGCKVFHKWDDQSPNPIYRIYTWDDTSWNMNNLNIDKIIWHTIYIGNILQYILSKKRSFFFNNYPIEEVCSLLEGNWKDDKIFWNDFTKPINEQSEECIKYVCDLITSTENK